MVKIYNFILEYECTLSVCSTPETTLNHIK